MRVSCVARGVGRGMMHSLPFSATSRTAPAALASVSAPPAKLTRLLHLQGRLPLQLLLLLAPAAAAASVAVGS